MRGPQGPAGADSLPRRGPCLRFLRDVRQLIARESGRSEAGAKPARPRHCNGQLYLRHHATGQPGRRAGGARSQETSRLVPPRSPSGEGPVATRAVLASVRPSPQPRGWAIPLKALRLPLALLGALLGACATPQAAPARLVAVDDGRHGAARGPGHARRVAQPGHHGAGVCPRCWAAPRRPDPLVRLPRGREGRLPSATASSQHRGRPRLPARPVLLYRSAQNSAAAERPARRGRRGGAARLQPAARRCPGRPRRRLLLGVAPAGDQLATALKPSWPWYASGRPAVGLTRSRAALLTGLDQPPIAIGAGSFLGEILEAAAAEHLCRPPRTPPPREHRGHRRARPGLRPRGRRAAWAGRPGGVGGCRCAWPPVRALQSAGFRAAELARRP